MRNAGGFVAGTLVRTDQGLVPIEQLKVGDMVLSRPESTPNAPNAYKKVVNSFKSKEKVELFYLTYAVEDIDGKYKTKYLFCTDDHPFWVKDSRVTDGESYADIGWRPAQEMNGSLAHVLDTHNGIFLDIVDFDDEKSISATRESQVAIVYSGNLDNFFDFRAGYPVAIGGGGVSLGGSRLSYAMASTQAKRILSIDESDPEVNFFGKLRPTFEPYFADVYNIEVEDYHTYFVGDEGIWVHDTDYN